MILVIVYHLTNQSNQDAIIKNQNVIVKNQNEIYNILTEQQMELYQEVDYR